MTGIEVVNPVPIDEVRAWSATMATTFLGSTRGPEFDAHVEAWRREWPAERIWGARADGRWIATLAAEGRRLTVPGPNGTTCDVAVDAVTAVTVSATHRRRGVLTRMLSESLQAARERNDPFSILIAAEWPIYGRFGYAPVLNSADYTYFPRRSEVRPARDGSIRQVEPEELAAVAAPVFDRARRLYHGQVDRPGDWWPRRLGLVGYRPVADDKTPNFVLHESASGPDGLLWWTAESDFELNGDMARIRVGDLTASTSVAYQNLWAYLSGIDLVDEISLTRRPIDEPVRWLLRDGRALRQTYAGDALWLRLLNVPAALGARSYAGSGRLVIEVVDADLGGSAAGRFLLESDEGNSSCRPTQQSADLRLDHRVLASMYLGGFSAHQLAIFGDVVQLTTGALDRADLMFATAQAPWNATGF